MSLVYWPIPSSLDPRPILQPTPLHLKWVWLKLKGRQFSTLSHPVMSVALSFKDFACSVLRFIFSPAARPNLSQYSWYWKRSARLCPACETRVGVHCLLLQKLCLQFGCLRQSYFLPSLFFTDVDSCGFSRTSLRIYHACSCMIDPCHGKRWNPSTADTTI